MDPPSLSTTQPQPDSTQDSSPKSRAGDLNQQAPAPKLRLMCSYGGHIVPRLHDKSLCYVGGDTRMVVLSRTSTLSDLLTRLAKTLNSAANNFSLKYQLPNEDLDSLISVSNDEDLDNMIDEYDRLSKLSNPKPGRIRLFLFPVRPETTHSMGPILDGSNRSEDWFLNALNGVQELQRGYSDPALNCLMGLDSNIEVDVVDKKVGGNQDVHSVPDSPIIGNTSSFGSTSSPPSFMNLPPIRVHVEQRGGGGGGSGIEEQFAQMGVTTGGVQKQFDEAGRVYSEDERSDHGGVVGFLKQQQQQQQQQQQMVQGGMNLQPQQKQQQQQQQQFGGDLASPDSVSSDNSLSGAFARQKPVMYQDPNGQSSTGSNSNRLPQSMQMQQVSESGYPYHPQYEQHQQQMLQRHQHQQQQQQQHHQHQQQHLLQQQQQQQQQHGQTQPQTQQGQQQYVQAGGQFIQHHPGSMPVPSYYPVYPSQQSHPHQYPMYYMPAGQTQGYSLPSQQQPNMSDGQTSVSSNRTQMTNNPTMMTNSSPYNLSRNMNMPPPKSESGPGVYRTATAAGGASQRVQVPSGQLPSQSQPQQHQLPSQPQPQPQQHQLPSQSQPQPQQQQQFMGYSQMHHPSQSIAQNMGAASGYAFDPVHTQVYYTQAPGLASQYQGVTSNGPSMMMSDASSQLSTESAK